MQPIFAYASIATLLFWRAIPTLAETVIDLQWAICDQDAKTVLEKLREDGLGPYKANNITYYDTWPPSYTAQGLAFRKKVKHHHHLSMTKARFDEETENVPPEADCVWDQYGNTTYYTCSLAAPLKDEDKGLWSEDQIAFAQRYQDVRWDDLVPYGPFLNPKWKLYIEGYKAVFDDVMAEAEGERLHLMEIEIKTGMSWAEKVHGRVDRYLRDRGIAICEPLQLPKTLRLFNALAAPPRAISKDEQAVLSAAGSLRTERRLEL